MVARTEGERWDHKHQPKIIGESRYCCAILPSGAICNRPCNFVAIDWLVPREPGDPRSPGHWRHNPRPYVNH